MRLGVILLCLTCACTKNPCKERVDQLHTIAIELNRQQLLAEPPNYIELGDLAKGAEVATGSFSAGPFVVRAKGDAGLSTAPTLAAIGALRAKGPVRLCGLAQDVKPQWSVSANPAEVARALALVKEVSPDDRATVLAAVLGDSKICKVEECLAMSWVAPRRKASVVTKCVAEKLEDCRCSKGDCERAIALMTVILDAWDYTGDCIEVAAVLGDAGGSLPSQTTFGQLPAALKLAPAPQTPEEVLKDATEAAQALAKEGFDTAEPRSDENRCDVKFGAEPTQVLRGDEVGATSDYWLTPQQMREEIAYDEKDPAEQAILLKQDPVKQILHVYCYSRDIMLELLVGKHSRYADVPMGAKTYPLGASDGKPGTFWGSIRFKEREELYPVAGALVVTRFDKAGVAGTFSFSSEGVIPGEKPTVTVSGRFQVNR